MTSPHDILDGQIVVDASVLINLLATSDPAVILRALGEPMVVADAAREVRRNPRTGATGREVLEPLLASGLLHRVTMAEHEAETFVELVGASPPDDLDDGEAATIAFALSRGHAVAIDEAKAQRILSEKYDRIRCMSTVALYRGLLEREVFDRHFICACVYDSIKLARMRVATTEIAWVCALLDPEQREGCTSLRRSHRR